MNNINFNVSNTSHSSSISLIDEVSNSNISFFISDTALYSKDIKDIQLDSLVTAYDLDNKAILEATTYSNSLLLGVNTLNETDIQTEANIELISEDRNRIAVKSNDELIAQITAIKVIDEAGKELRSSMHIQENGIELVIEEEITRATVTIEFAPYIEFVSGNAMYLNTFGEYDYWFFVSDNSIYKVNKYNHKELYTKIGGNYIISSLYAYHYPIMISETVFFSNYQKVFYKIEQAGTSPTITKIKDDTSFFGLIPLYDNVWLTVYRDTSNHSYVYQIIEFTDIETATYEVKDTYTVEVGKSANEQFYFPYVIYDYDDKLAVCFHTYNYDSYLPTTDQHLSARIDKENKCFNFDGIEPMQCLIYEDDEYTLVFNWKDRYYYTNGVKSSGHFSSISKPLTLRGEDNNLYVYSVSYGIGSSYIAQINLGKKSAIQSLTFSQKIWQNGSYAGQKSVDKKSVTEAWDVFKEADIKKRSIRETTKDDYIVPEGAIANLGYANVSNKNPIYLKKEVIQNKKFLFTEAFTLVQLLQKDRIISSAVTTTENTDIEVRPYEDREYFFKHNFILTEEKDFNIYEAVIDTKRIAKQDVYDLQINENATIFDKVDNKNDINFSKWEYNTESFEGEPLINFRGNATSAYIRDELASTGSKSLFMTGEYRGTREYIEFDTVSDSISFKYYPHSKQYSTEFYIYINGVQQLSVSDYGYNRWEEFSYKLNPQEKSTIKLEYYKAAALDSSRYNGFFIDDISCNMLSNTTEATVYFDTYDLAMYNSSQAVNIKFNDLEISDNVEQAIYYSTNAGTSWTLFKGMLPNEDNILLKAVFTKPTIDEEAYVRFSSVRVMPGELDWVTNVDTSRKIYDTSDIVPELIENISVSKDEENRYNLLFKDEATVIETFEGDLSNPIIDYALHGVPGNESSIPTILIHSSPHGGMLTLFFKGYSNAPDNELSQPRITFKTRASRLSFLAKQNIGSHGIISVFVNGVKLNSYTIESSGPFQEYICDLNLIKEAEVSICYAAEEQIWGCLLDNITLEGVAVDGFGSYIQTEVVDLSIFPSDITCELVTDDLQSSHDLDIKYFYTINDGQDWIEFDKTLPNNSNVRLKAEFTKDTEEEVIASFKNLIIRQDDGSTIKATIRLATTRTVHASNDKSYGTSREVVNTANPVVYTERQVYKDVDMALTTNRKTAINDETTILTQREVVRVNTVKKNLDTIRHIHKSLINSLNTTRNISNNTSSMADTKVIVTNTKEATIDTKRQVWSIIDVDKRIDTTRIVYITASSFVTQLNIDLKLSKGTLLLDNQEFN